MSAATPGPLVTAPPRPAAPEEQHNHSADTSNKALTSQDFLYNQVGNFVRTIVTACSCWLLISCLKDFNLMDQTEDRWCCDSRSITLYNNRFKNNIVCHEVFNAEPFHFEHINSKSRKVSQECSNGCKNIRGKIQSRPYLILVGKPSQ